MHTILYADDDPDDVLLVQLAFINSRLPFCLEMATTGRQAIGFLENRAASADPFWPVPGLLLLDLKIPELTGFEVLRWVRRHPTLSELPVFILTASPFPEDVERAMMLGASRYFVKSPGFQDVIIAVARLFGLPEAASPAEVPGAGEPVPADLKT